MLFDLKIITILLFVILSISITFFIKTRFSAVSALIISHLVLILFFSLTITNYDSFKEIALMIIVYLMLTLFLITNNEGCVDNELLTFRGKSFELLFLAMLIFVIFSGALYLTSATFGKMKKDRISSQFPKVSAIMQDELIKPEERKMAYLSKKLSENFLFKRSTDVILIIITTTAITLLLRKKSNNKNLL